MKKLKRIQAREANWRAPASSMGGVLLPLNCASRTVSRKRGSGCTPQAPKTNLIASAKRLEHQRAKPRSTTFAVLDLQHSTARQRARAR